MLLRISGTHAIVSVITVLFLTFQCVLNEIMGDMLLKQKPPRVHQWQSAEMLSRKSWYPTNYHRQTQQRQTFNFRPSMDHVNNVRDSTYGYHTPYHQPTINKGKDYYFLSPYYRNAMPPPPNPISQLHILDHARSRRNFRKPEVSCRCRSRSMEDVRTEVVEVDWDEGVNGTKIDYQNGNKFGRIYNRRSVEDLLADTHYKIATKRVGSFQVRLL